jgi:hypothetical protein
VPYPLLGWLAAPATGSPDLSLFAQYGVLGVVATMLLWFAKGSIQRERERGDRLETENGRLNELIRDRVIPALTSATRAVEENVSLLQAMQRERERERTLRTQTEQATRIEDHI